jgi:glycosyltransferase involved in cell wall biosynthesis
MFARRGRECKQRFPGRWASHMAIGHLSCIKRLVMAFNDDDTPLVSVIVPAYDCEAYLGDALASLMNQTIRNIEIIVVDDGSTDASADVADEYASRDSRIRVIRRSSASGHPACARNDGLRVARGTYIALLDADDVAEPWRLASSVAAMEETGTLFAFADYRKMYQDTGEIERSGVLESADFLNRAADYLTHVDGNVFLCKPAFPAFLLTCIAVNTPTIVFKRELLDTEPTWFDESIVCFEDVDLWFRLAKHTQFVFINEPHALNRRHSASLTASNPLPTKIDGIAVRKNHLQRLMPSLSREEVGAAKQTIADLLWDVSYTNWCRGQLKSARAGFLDSWRAKPTRRATVGYLKAFVPRHLVVDMMENFTHTSPSWEYSTYQSSNLSIR